MKNRYIIPFTGCAIAVSRLPARSVLLLRRGVHWTPAPSRKGTKLTLFAKCPRCGRPAQVVYF
jgi:hypothetical protein